MDVRGNRRRRRELRRVRGPHRLPSGRASGSSRTRRPVDRRKRDDAGPRRRSSLQGTADGRYELRICDTEFRGNQDFVYRLTLTRGPVIDGAYPLGGRRTQPVDLHLFGANLSTDRLHVTLPNRESSPFVLHPQIGRDTWGELRLETNDVPEYVEETARPAGGGAHLATLPAVLNGRILRPGEADLWQVTAHKGEQFLLDLRAGRLGSLLDSVLTILDANGKRLATCDDMSPGETDSRLSWKVPADGMYCIRVEDRLPTRGGPQYTYRLDIEPATSVPDFHFKLATDTVNVERGHEARFTVTADRSGGFNGPIALDRGATDRGAGDGSQHRGRCFKSRDRSQSRREGTRRDDGNSYSRRSRSGRKEGGPHRRVPTDPRDPLIDHVAVAVAVPTPFKFTASYDQAYTPRGSVQVRHYHLERTASQVRSKSGWPTSRFAISRESADRRSSFPRGPINSIIR